MKQLLTGWNFSRLFRLLIGLGALVQAILQKEVFMMVAGLWILSGAVFNFGCCGGGACAVPKRQPIRNKEVADEEVGADKQKTGIHAEHQ